MKQINSSIEPIEWPVNNVLAIQTTRLKPNRNLNTVTSSSAESPLKQVTTDSPFQSFNLGLHVNDNASHVAANREYLVQSLAEGLSYSGVKIQWLEQIHGNNVVTVSEVITTPCIADASITREKNIALAIMTADCLPILLADKQGNEIAAIHGGWRPLAHNIIANTLNKMVSNVADIVAWLGPCIGNSAFEVGEDVRDVFITQNRQFESAFQKKPNGKYLADLHAIATMQLHTMGVNQITRLPECTFTLSNKYYSYRKQKITGRMATVICRK